MTPQKWMRRRVTICFVIMCLTLATQTIASAPIFFVAFFRAIGIELPIDSYYTDFVFPQILYPVLNAMMALVGLRIAGVPFRHVLSVKPIKGDFFPWLGVFLGAATVMNYVLMGIFSLLELIGIQIPDVFASFNPENLTEAIFYFIVLAIFPPVCEEILCRSVITGTLKHFHPWVAVVLSSVAFALMHGTLQQIPFAFALGLILGLVYVKTGNLLYPILLHFANNAWACVLTALPLWLEDSVISVISYAADGVFVLFGILSLVVLLRRKRFSLKEVPHSLPLGQAIVSSVSSPPLWIFTGLYLLITLLSFVALFLPSTLPSDGFFGFIAPSLGF